MTTLRLEESWPKQVFITVLNNELNVGHLWASKSHCEILLYDIGSSWGDLSNKISSWATPFVGFKHPSNKIDYSEKIKNFARLLCELVKSC